MHVTQCLRSEPALASSCSCCRAREGSALCLSVSCPFMSLGFFIVRITDHYMLNIDWAVSSSDEHCSPFGRPNIDSPQSAHQEFRCQIKIPKCLLQPYKQFSGDLFVRVSDGQSFIAFFSFCSPSRETSSTCSSDPGLFTNDEGRQGI